VVHPTAYVHPSAVLIGDVIVGPRCYVGPLASLRGDFGRLILEEGANVQDTCVMHGFPRLRHGGRSGRPHRPRRRAARLPHRRNAMVGMNAW
jgi:phenylacetic acid degradation protein